MTTRCSQIYSEPNSCATDDRKNCPAPRAEPIPPQYCQTETQLRRFLARPIIYIILHTTSLGSERKNIARQFNFLVFLLDWRWASSYFSTLTEVATNLAA